MRVLTAAEARGLDGRSIASGRVSGAALMQRAGDAVAEAIAARWGEPLAWRVLVLCGAGSNGGDGFVAARRLRAMGAMVRVAALGPRDACVGDARAHRDAMEAAGIAAEDAVTPAALEAIVSAGPWDVAIDAMLGTGAQGALRGPVVAGASALTRLHAAGTRVVAVDLPTGVSADDGALQAGAVRADLTITFGALKRGHVLHPGAGACGEVRVADIGLDDAGALGVARLAAADVAVTLPRRDARAHKGDAGRVLVVGGAAGMTGAALLAARGAYRAGAGHVRACVPASVADHLLAACPELMSVACGETSARSLAASGLADVLAEAATADAVVLGPGLSRHARSAALVRALVPAIGSPLVLDADALHASSPAAEALVACVRARTAATVLTPHVGEMARLTGLAAAEVESRRIDLAAECALAWGVTVVLKGAPTVIASPDGRTAVNATGNPGMATAGMGDVLAGALGALLAQGVPAHEAACAAAFVHGLAGDLAAAALGATGLLASDVAERLPVAMQALRGA